MPMPYDEYMPPRVHQQRDVDLSGLGPDAGDEYTGDSMEDFYDYLLTPRNQREKSQHGSITHYGPSRFASVRPEDAAMAQMVMRLMENKDIHESNQTTRESDMARRAAADEMMMPQGRGGGEIRFQGGTGEESMGFGAMARAMQEREHALPVGGGIPQGPPPAQGPMSDRDRALLGAGGVGGVDESRVSASEAQGTNYPGHGAQGPSMADRRDMGKQQESIGLLGSELTRAAQGAPELEGLNAEQVTAAFLRNPKKFDFLRGQVTAYLLKIDRYNQTYSEGGGGQGPPDLEFD